MVVRATITPMTFYLGGRSVPWDSLCNISGRVGSFQEKMSLWIPMKWTIILQVIKWRKSPTRPAPLCLFSNSRSGWHLLQNKSVKKNWPSTPTKFWSSTGLLVKVTPQSLLCVTATSALPLPFCLITQHYYSRRAKILIFFVSAKVCVSVLLWLSTPDPANQLRVKQGQTDTTNTHPCHACYTSVHCSLSMSWLELIVDEVYYYSLHYAIL